jgi:hypothetical protein
MANIDIKSLFSDILPDPAQQQRERVLQQNEAVNQANLVGTLGGMAAYLAPQRSAALSSAATGLLGIDTRTEAEKTLDKLKAANVDLSSQQGLIQAATMLQETDPLKAAELRGAAAELKVKQTEESQKAAESKSLVDFRNEQTLASQTQRIEKAAQETLENANAGLTINSASQIMRRVSPELADQFTTLFPSTLEGANAARDFALEAIKAPERDFIVETIVDEQGIPQRVVFDKNDSTYKRVLGVDDAVLSGNAGKRFGKTKANAGVAIPADAFNYKANASKMLSIAFSPYLEGIVGPSDPARLVPSFVPSQLPFIGLSQEEKNLRRDIDVTKTQGILPIIRLLAPVTDTDRDMLLDIMPSTKDRQDVWIRRTLEEVIPQALNVMYTNLSEEGMSLAAAQQFGMASAAQVFNQIADGPAVFREYSLERAVDAAFDMLPRIENINLDEYPKGTKLFKDPSGKVYDGELVQSIMKAKNLDAAQAQSWLQLELIEGEK